MTNPVRRFSVGGVEIGRCEGMMGVGKVFLKHQILSQFKKQKDVCY